MRNILTLKKSCLSEEVITLLKNVISTYSGEDKQSFIEALLITDPFCNYSDEIESAMKRGEIV